MRPAGLGISIAPRRNRRARVPEAGGGCPARVRLDAERRGVPAPGPGRPGPRRLLAAGDRRRQRGAAAGRVHQRRRAVRSRPAQFRSPVRRRPRGWLRAPATRRSRSPTSARPTWRSRRRTEAATTSGRPIQHNGVGASPRRRSTCRATDGAGIGQRRGRRSPPAGDGVGIVAWGERATCSHGGCGAPASASRPSRPTPRLPGLHGASRPTSRSIGTEGNSSYAHVAFHEILSLRDGRLAAVAGADEPAAGIAVTSGWRRPTGCRLELRRRDDPQITMGEYGHGWITSAPHQLERAGRDRAG